MGNCGGGAAHRGSVSGTGARHGAGPVSLCHSRLSLRHGSKFINQTVARLLNKLMIEQTKSRPRHSNDNGLAETKNGAIIGKHMGWGHLQEVHADPIQQFYSAHLNPYLNIPPLCSQADVEVDAKGRIRRRYRRYQTPLETLLSLPKPQQY